MRKEVLRAIGVLEHHAPDCPNVIEVLKQSLLVLEKDPNEPDGMVERVGWVKWYRVKTGASLKDAVDKHKALFPTWWDKTYKE